MGSATPIDFNEVAKDMIELIVENKDIDRWIDEKAKIESEAWGEGVLKKMQEKSDVLQPAGGTTFDENFCLSHLLKYTYNVAMLQRQRKILEDYLIYVQNDNKIYGTDTAMGSKNLHQMKALYTSQYTILVDFWIKRFRIIYYFILVVYIGILVKNRKYRSKMHIGIAVLLCVYPLIINHIMVRLLSAMDYMFQYTPANAYRNLYNQNINKLEKEDIYVHYTQIPY
uniref:Uncharacterized protein n=1 Tax=viral metagenome TaxID=1070528 RepID=A0A6C0BWI5_9ZZZZ